MHFSAILDSIRFAGSTGHVTVAEDWSQGRATYGGLVAAVGNAVLRRLVPAERLLRSLQTTFIGPAGATTWRIEAQVLRVGKAVTLARCDIVDGEQVAATLVGVYGGPRRSVINVRPAAKPAADGMHELKFPAQQAPAFLQHFDVRWTDNYSHGKRTATQAFIRHRDRTALTESHVVGLVDCIPSPALMMIDAFAPGSSLIWTLEFFEHTFAFGPEQWWRLDTRIDAAADGYVNQTGLLLDPNGTPVALTRQLFTIFG
jgi:acyl-CoA thioesterase